MAELLLSVILSSFFTLVIVAAGVTFPWWAIWLTLMVIFWLGLVFITDGDLDLNIFD